MNLTKQDRIKIQKMMLPAMKKLEKDQDIKSVLMEMYQEHYPDELYYESVFATDQILSRTAHYCSAFEQADRHLDEWIKEAFDQSIQNKSREQQIETCYAFKQALDFLDEHKLIRIMNSWPGAKEHVLQEMKMTEYQGDYSQEEYEELYNSCIQGLSGLNISKACLKKSLSGLGYKDHVLYIAAEMGINSAEFKALASMAAYILAENGDLEGIPKNIGIEQIVIGTCTVIDMQETVEGVQRGYITGKRAAMRLKVLYVVGWVLFFAVSTPMTLTFLNTLDLSAGMMLLFGLIFIVLPQFICYVLSEDGFAFEVIDGIANKMGEKKIEQYADQNSADDPDDPDPFDDLWKEIDKNGVENDETDKMCDVKDSDTSRQVDEDEDRFYISENVFARA